MCWAWRPPPLSSPPPASVLSWAAKTFGSQAVPGSLEGESASQVASDKSFLAGTGGSGQHGWLLFR